jgi:hypothetical protein
MSGLRRPGGGFQKSSLRSLFMFPVIYCYAIIAKRFPKALS